MLGEAGTNPLDIDELVRLQQIVIGDMRFVRIGLREHGGFMGEHDRDTGLPIPEHISARPEDLESLLSGLIEFNTGVSGNVNPVVAAACLSFGFVYMYRFFDATSHTEFLFSCVQRTIEKDLPEGTEFLEAYDRFRACATARHESSKRCTGRRSNPRKSDFLARTWRTQMGCSTMPVPAPPPHICVISRGTVRSRLSGR